MSRSAVQVIEVMIALKSKAVSAINSRGAGHEPLTGRWPWRSLSQPPASWLAPSQTSLNPGLNPTCPLRVRNRLPVGQFTGFRSCTVYLCFAVYFFPVHWNGSCFLPFGNCPAHSLNTPGTLSATFAWAICGQTKVAISKEQQLEEHKSYEN